MYSSTVNLINANLLLHIPTTKRSFNIITTVDKFEPAHLLLNFNEILPFRVLKTISQKEKLGDINVKEIVARSEGDLRNAILSLQFNGATMNHRFGRLE